MKLFLLKRIKPEYNFFLLLVAIESLYNYHHIFFVRPCGIHQWRFCLSAAFPFKEKTVQTGNAEIYKLRSYE